MEFFITIFNKFANVLKTVLPTSPFKEFLAEVGSFEYLGELNWFVPVGDILRVMAVWLGAVTMFHVYSIVMRWLKVIDG